MSFFMTTLMRTPDSRLYLSSLASKLSTMTLGVFQVSFGFPDYFPLTGFLLSCKPNKTYVSHKPLILGVVILLQLKAALL